MNDLDLGKFAEKFVANYLISTGYEILEMNRINKKGYRVGEIDVIAEDKKKEIVFVEVKARKGEKGDIVPEENITPDKIKKIVKVANDYLREEKKQECQWRIDAVSIIFDMKTRKAHLKHIKYIRS